MDDLREVIARAIAKADRVEICSDASYRHSAYGGKADAALAAIKQAGFVVVPAEPTEAMREVGGDNVFAAAADDFGDDAAKIYRAMIEASNAPT